MLRRVQDCQSPDKKLQEAQTMKADRERKQMAALMAEEKAEEHGSEHQAKSIADRKQDK